MQADFDRSAASRIGRKKVDDLKKIIGLAAICWLLASASSVAQVPAPDAHYESRFDFTVDLPPGLPACVDEDTNDGVGIYLVPTVRCEADNDHIPVINISGEYNAAGNANTLRQLEHKRCSDTKAEKIVRNSGLQLSGRRAASCTTYLPDGTVKMCVGTIWKPYPSHRLAWVEVAGELATTRDRLDQDAAIFRKTLATLVILPDGAWQ